MPFSHCLKRVRIILCSCYRCCFSQMVIMSAQLVYPIVFCIMIFAVAQSVRRHAAQQCAGHRHRQLLLSFRLWRGIPGGSSLWHRTGCALRQVRAATLSVALAAHNVILLNVPFHQHEWLMFCCAVLQVVSHDADRFYPTAAIASCFKSTCDVRNVTGRSVICLTSGSATCGRSSGLAATTCSSTRTTPS